MSPRLWRYVLLLTIGLAAACRTAAPAPTSPGPADTLAGAGPYVGLNLASLGSYRASLELGFVGEHTWRYVLGLRSSGPVTEYTLHMEGLPEAQNPGDVRVVTQGGASQMHGPGTDGECWQFPADLDLGPAFLTPDQLVPPAQLAAAVQPAGQEQIMGRNALRFTTGGVSLGAWESVRVTVWVAEPEGAVLAQDMLLTGPDPIGSAGRGQLAGRFRVDEIGPQAIEPITGCEIDLPLPTDAARVVRLPGLVAFDSPSDLAALVAFYQAQLPAFGWVPAAEAQSAASGTVLSFIQGEQTLEVNVETMRSGTHVELLRP